MRDKRKLFKTVVINSVCSRYLCNRWGNVFEGKQYFGKAIVFHNHIGANNNFSFVTAPCNRTFAAAVFYGVASLVGSVAVADVSGDNKLDIIFTDYGSSYVGVLRNYGNGRFAAPVTYLTGPSPKSVAVADVNGDNRPDIVTNSGSNNVAVFLNTDNGTFAAQVTYSTGAFAYFVALADANGDNKSDFIVANYGSNKRLCSPQHWQWQVCCSSHLFNWL